MSKQRGWAMLKLKLVVALMLGLAFAWMTLTPITPGAVHKCPAPKVFNFQAIAEIRRDVRGFTEGLEMHGDVIYESTGKFGQNSRINSIDPRDGRISTLVSADASYFGEGITFFGDRLYLLTYLEHRAYIFDKNMRRIKEVAYNREGWGLTHNSNQLIASDGSNSLYFLSPEDFSTTRILQVLDRAEPLRKLNELEYVDGAIWANIFETWEVVKISPNTGCVQGRADLVPLRSLMTQSDRRAISANGNFLPNGIAYDSLRKLFVVTGKNWPMLYTGRFVEVR